MLCMETILKIRRLFHKEGLSQRQISERLGLNRRTVKKHLTTIDPPKYQRKEQSYPKLAPFLPFLKEFLQEEAKKTPKERLTARRLYELIRSKGYQGQYNALTCFIRRFNAEQSLNETTVFIPQHFPLADAYQFDWSIETVKLSGEIVTLNIAHFRLCHSRAFYVRAYPNQQMEMLIDAHNYAFEFLGGTCKRGIYDNMKSAVTTIKSGKDRDFNESFLGMMNHFMIEPVACTPASAWEKGQVERQVRTLRKRFFEPTLSFSTLEELNHYLTKQCQILMQEFKHPDNKRQSVYDVWTQEQAVLIPTHPYHWYRPKLIRVNSLSLVSYLGHKYSVPCHLVGKKINLQAFATKIKIIYLDQCIAVHERSFDKDKSSYNPWHYLKALNQKPGALRNGEPFLNWQLPEPIQELQRHLLEKPRGDRAMVELLNMIAEYGEDVGVTAASIALEEGVPTVEAIQNIINRLLEPIVPELSNKDIPLNTPPQGNCQRYNSLLKGNTDASS